MGMLVTVIVIVMVVIMMVVIMMVVIMAVRGSGFGVRSAWCGVRGVWCGLRTASFVFVHIELDGRHAGAEHAPGVHVVAGHGQAAERAPQVVDRQAGIDERAEQHVAGNPGKTIEIQDTRHQ